MMAVEIVFNNIPNLIEKIDLANWIATHKKIGSYDKITVDEYAKTVRQLIIMIRKKGLSVNDSLSLSLIFREKFYALVSELSKAEFCRLIIKIKEGDHGESLDKLRDFLVTSAQMLHVLGFSSTCKAFASALKDLRSGKNVINECQRMIDKSAPLLSKNDLNEIIENIENKNYAAINYTITMFENKQRLAESYIN